MYFWKEWIVEMYLGVSGVFCIIDCYVNVFMRFSVIFRIYEHS